MTAEMTIVCDSCGTVGGGSSTGAATVRKELKAAGWLVGLPGGEDVCNNCKPQHSGTAPNPTAGESR